jgi:hypothetical protein
MSLLAGGEFDAKRFCRRYMFDENELLRRRQALSDGDSGFLEWCSGDVTGKTLRTFAEQLAGVSDAVAVAKKECLARLPLLERDGERFNEVIGIFIVRGASSCDQRMHSPTKLLPLSLFRPANPRLNAERVEEEVGKLHSQLRMSCPMHRDEFTGAVIDHYGSSIAQLRRAVPVLGRVGRRAKLAIFQAECCHSETRQHELATKGKVGTASTSSRNVYLSKIHGNHVRRFGYKSVSDYWTIKFAKPKSNIWKVKKMAMGVKLKGGGSRTNSYTRFRKGQLNAFRNAHPYERKIFGHPIFESRIKAAWQAVPADEKQELAKGFT